MNRTADLLVSAKTVHDKYRAGRIERETVREWATRLGSYPEPHGARVKASAEWFRRNRNDEVDDEMKRQDLAVLAAIFAE
ncbi:hypothetical protein [Rhizobium sp. BE258]|uniref:hypothetical protein n=1 Tax=Rhizobium sp. BE258 TaxID=2817722 RepID=UPI00285EFDB4|nr:hypothetical protein [Rhizobium sp. BE258]MDR7148036.1 hypothetical protein [Rhizobium sp. BE258]